MCQRTHAFSRLLLLLLLGWFSLYLPYVIGFFTSQSRPICVKTRLDRREEIIWKSKCIYFVGTLRSNFVFSLVALLCLCFFWFLSFSITFVEHTLNALDCLLLYSIHFFPSAYIPIAVIFLRRDFFYLLALGVPVHINICLDALQLFS